MAHTVGALEMPAPPASDGSSLDPGLDYLGAYFAAVITHWVGDAWASVAPNEPVVRTIETHDPAEVDFSAKKLPALYVWRDGNSKPKRLTDGSQEKESQIHILWVLPNATQAKSALRHPFFNAFDNAISLAIINERDPAYRRPEDTDDASIAYGSDVMALAGIDWWTQGPVQRVPVEVPIPGAGTQKYPGYLATLTIAETTTSDPRAYGTAPTVIRGDITDGQDPTLVRQSFRVPKTGA